MTTTDLMAKRQPVKRRPTLLLGGLLAIGVVYAISRMWVMLPYEPRLVFTNESGSPIANLRVVADSRMTNLGPLAPGRSVNLPLSEEYQDTYTIQSWTFPATRLTSLVPIVRAERRDIEMAVDFHGCLVLEGYEIMSPGATVLWDESE